MRLALFRLLPALAIALAATLLLPAGRVAAQGVPPQGNSSADTKTSADAPPPRPQARAERLDKLYTRLGAAGDEAEAKGITEQIDRIFERSGSDTADLLLTRARQAAEAKEFDTALDLLDFVINLQPNWAEAYHRRALVHFVRRDEEAALRDLRAVLAREPRHISALSGLAAILKSLSREKESYIVTRRLLELYPANADAKASFERMRTAVEGQGI